jgi:CheY-like chemotaxis protein
MTSNASAPPAKGLLLCRDLLFSTKITGTAQALGFAVEVTASVEDLVSRVQQDSYRCILLDLSVADVSVADVVEAAGLGDRARPAIVAFGSHVETARLKEAEQAGCDEVMPRSRFASTLPELLGRLMAPPEEA